MPPIPIVVLEIDDNTPQDLSPFTNDPSMWSFEQDFNLYTRTAAETFRTIHESVGDSKFRSYPERVARGTFKLLDGLVGPDEVSWFSGSELSAVEHLLPSGELSVEKSLRMLFEAVAVAGRHFGPDRVRLVFAFS